MSRCFLTFAEDSSESSEEWDEAAGERKPTTEGLRPYCTCDKLLRRIAKLPDYAVLLRCAGSLQCTRCEEVILAGEMHFRCSACQDVHICRECGPGVHIDRSLDFFNTHTHESDVLDIPSKALHVRKQRLSKLKVGGGITRGITLDKSVPDVQGSAHLNLAERVVENARRMCQEIKNEGPDVSDKDWGDERTILELLGTSRAEESAEAVSLLAKGAHSIFASQSILTEVKAPCKVFGDLHGQLRDLLLLWASFGFPASPEAPSVIFNGDFVDRGKHQVEVVTVLFALKIVFPHNVFLNRGNHEELHMNAKYGFQRACLGSFGEQFGDQVFRDISSAFMQLPLASLIEEKILCVHGGIGDGRWTLAQLKKTRRPLSFKELQLEQNHFLWNILWSDPIEDDDLGGSSSAVFGVHASPRGKLAVKFGWNVTQQFCASNGLDLVVRSHQAKKGGYGFDVMHNESLIRVFSARDYEGHQNDCAILSVADAEEGEGGDCGVLSVRPQVLSSLSKNAEDDGSD